MHVDSQKISWLGWVLIAVMLASGKLPARFLNFLSFWLHAYVVSGLCPPSNFINIGNGMFNCTDNSDCGNGQLCCLVGSSRVCVDDAGGCAVRTNEMYGYMPCMHVIAI